ncbi:MAG: rhomboid family intramembrane serine protease [Paludibacteraceae bacterium]|nr:rhomboid family intramembrane serine protease [Paludibacteraceae bacterium]
MSPYRSSFLGGIPVIVKNLLLINLFVWLADLLLPQIVSSVLPQFDLSDYLGLHYWASERFNALQLISYMFMHGSFSHMFFNMFAVYMFGSALEHQWGGVRFLFYYLLTGVGAGVVQEIMWTMEYQSLLSALDEAISLDSGSVLLPYEAELSKMLKFPDLRYLGASELSHMKELILNAPVTVGASGSVFGLLLAFGWLYPQAELMLLFLPIPIKARLFVALYAVAELFLGVANFSGDNVAHFAHLGGMIFGYFLILYWRRRGTLY